MKIFVFEPYCGYSFGSTLVAASSLAEAEAVLQQDGRHILEFIGLKFKEILEGITAEGQPRIVHSTSGME